MIKLKNRDNLYFDGMDPVENYFHPRKLELLKKSWAEVFRNHVLPKLPVKEIAKHFSETMGRPTKELRAMCGVCVLQQFFDFKDEETRDQLSFNQQWHYALDVLDQEDQIISLKTLWNCRHLLLNDKLAKSIFNTVTDALYNTIDDTVKSRYAKNDEDLDYFGSTRPSASKKRLEDIAADLYQLLEHFKNNNDVKSMYSYKLIKRVFDEQCLIENKQVVVKPAKEISADSLQNPSDVDASYDGHKGQGYQVQVMETYGKKNKDDDDDSNQQSLQLITYVDVEPAHYHDSNAVKPALDDTKERDILPSELDADTSYGSQENVKEAKERNVELVAPVPGKIPQNNLSSFAINDNTKEIESCPQAHTPQIIKHNKKGSISCIWHKEICQNCSMLSECSVQESKKGYLIRYTPQQAETAIRRRYEQSDEFKDKYRHRSGVEASISRYIHMTGARRLRYRGLERVDYAARLKALGINIFRTARFLANQENQVCFA